MPQYIPPPQLVALPGDITAIADDATSDSAVIVTRRIWTVTAAHSPFTVPQRGDARVDVDSTSGAVTVRLPAASGHAERYDITDKAGAALANDIIITTVEGGDRVQDQDGSMTTSVTMSKNNQCWSYMSDGASAYTLH